MNLQIAQIALICRQVLTGALLRFHCVTPGFLTARDTGPAASSIEVIRSSSYVRPDYQLEQAGLINGTNGLQSMRQRPAF
jgi:hypothetical protein